MFERVEFEKIENKDNVLDKLKKEGYQIHYLENESITNIEEFFMWIKDILPLDPKLNGNVNLDAFTDSFWEGLTLLENPKQCLIWLIPDEFVKSDRCGVGIVLECFEDVANTL